LTSKVLTRPVIKNLKSKMKRGERQTNVPKIYWAKLKSEMKRVNVKTTYPKLTKQSLSLK